MRALLYRPGHAPDVIEIDGRLSTPQKIVGGYIEVVAISPTIVGYVNDDGLKLRLEPSAYVRTVGVVRGSMVIVGIEQGDERGLTDEEVEHARASVLPLTPDHPLAQLRDRPR